MSSSSALTVNPRKIVHETVDGETILIHLETGSYYSLTGAGAEIWALLDAGRSPAAIALELAERHGQAESEVGSAVKELLDQLAAEDILEQSANGAGSAGPPPAWRAPSWSPPKLEKYDDMQDFLLVDPIHEVDDSGWPSRKAG
jgi:hypothetical protein